MPALSTPAVAMDKALPASEIGVFVVSKDSGFGALGGVREDQPVWRDMLCQGGPGEVRVADDDILLALEARAHFPSLLVNQQ